MLSSPLIIMASVVGFFILMILCIILGQRIGKNRDVTTGLSVTEGAVFTIMGLLVAFTFANAAQRFDYRRSLIIEETNAISTAYLRLDMLQPDDRLTLQTDFLAYIKARLAAYKAAPDFDAANIELEKAKAIQNTIWINAVKACKNPYLPAAPMLLLPALNSMFDIAATRTAYTYFHPHYLIFVLLLVVALLSSLLTGFGLAARGKWASLHVISFVFVMTITIYIIIDLEYPRLAAVKESKFDSLLVSLKQDFENTNNSKTMMRYKSQAR